LFINYLMNPQVIANISQYIGNANANSAASPLLDAAIVQDASVYPPPEQQQRLFVQTEDSPEQARAITRLWQKFKTAQ
jgi:spermidine/putrescine-binding protein